MVVALVAAFHFVLAWAIWGQGKALLTRVAAPVMEVRILETARPAKSLPAKWPDLPKPQALRLPTLPLPAIAWQDQVTAAAPRPADPPSPPAAPAVVAMPKANDQPPPMITPARFDAAYLANPAPEYPLLSRRLGESGRVVLRVLVNAQGDAEAVEVFTTSGSARLDHAALHAVRRWRFEPARQGEMLVASWVQVPIVFDLRS